MKVLLSISNKKICVGFCSTAKCQVHRKMKCDKCFLQLLLHVFEVRRQVVYTTCASVAVHNGDAIKRVSVFIDSNAFQQFIEDVLQYTITQERAGSCFNALFLYYCKCFLLPKMHEKAITWRTTTMGYMTACINIR